MTGFDPAAIADRAALRRELGYGPDETVCVVAVGGSGVGADLLRRVIAASRWPRARVPGLRMVVVAGPRIDPASLPRADGVEVRGYVARARTGTCAACDVAVVQGGLATTMELVGEPPAVPVRSRSRDHFEQRFHVAHRLERYGAGRRMELRDGRRRRRSPTRWPTSWRGRSPTARCGADGAARAAALIAELRLSARSGGGPGRRKPRTGLGSHCQGRRGGHALASYCAAGRRPPRSTQRRAR